MVATIQDGDDAMEASKQLETIVKNQLAGKTNVSTTTTEKKASTPITEGKKDEAPKTVKKTRKTKVKAEKVVEEVAVEVTKEEVQNSLRDVAVFHKDASKAVALIEQVAGVKTLADVPEAKYQELYNMCKKAVA